MKQNIEDYKQKVARNKAQATQDNIVEIFPKSQKYFFAFYLHSITVPFLYQLCCFRAHNSTLILQ